MGSGKTTVGRKLAGRLGREFCDCDEEIERRTGASINLIFDIEGESGFRERESRMLEELASEPGRLVATGGGAVLSRHNRELMRRHGYVVWLRITLAQQIRRLQKDKKRPLLQTQDWKDTLARLARERDPLYEDVADLVFDVPNQSVTQTARRLEEAMRADRQSADRRRIGAGH